MSNVENLKPARSVAAPAAIDDDLVLHTRAEAAQILRTSVPTLERWGKLGIGPRFRNVGGRALYTRAELRRVSTPDADHPGAAA